MQVNIAQARKSLSHLIRAALAGKQVVIAMRDKPVARLVPIPAASSRQGQGRDIVAWLKANPLPHYARRNKAEIDAQIREAAKLGIDRLRRRLEPRGLALALDALG